MGALTIISCVVVLVAVIGASFEAQLRATAQSVVELLQSEEDRSILFSNNLLNLDGDILKRHGFRWSDITPSKELFFHPCVDAFECARLEVPLDWNSTDDHPESLALAIVRLQAKVPITDPSYGGVVLLNPGGPGGSGVDFAFQSGSFLQTIINAPSSPGGGSKDLTKHYDILSWDPRGVNNTTPFVTCLNDVSTISRWNSFDILLDTPDTSFDYVWARQKAFAASCATTHGVSPDSETKPKPDILNHASTSSSVLDMVAIIESFGAWRAAQSHLLAPDDNVAHARLAHVEGEEPLNYWGISYGTLLGATFAAMQPHRVRRVMLDAVVDAEDYYDGGWTTNLADFDAQMDRFFSYCAQAGKDCEVAAKAMEAGWRVRGPEDLKIVWSAIQDSLPMAVPATGTTGPEVITVGDFKRLVQKMSYAPIVKWEKLVSLVAPLLSGNGTAFAAYKQGTEAGGQGDGGDDKKVKRCPDTIDAHSTDCALEHSSLLHDMGSAAITCSDADPSIAIERSPEQYKAYLAFLHSQSKYAAEAWGSIMLKCVGWPGRAGWKWNMDGDGMGTARREIASNVTANPILFVGNELDNATPRRNAVALQRQFKGSRLLKVEIEGHSLLANPSLAAGRAVRRYFQTGELPVEGTVCLPHERPFLGAQGPNVEALPDVLSHEDQELLDSLWGGLKTLYSFL